MRLSAYAENDYRFSYLRTSNGAKVDLVIETPRNEYFGIAIKAADNPYDGKMRGLRALKEIVPHAKLFCASLAPRRRIRGDITIVPWKEIFAEIGLQSPCPPA